MSRTDSGRAELDRLEPQFPQPHRLRAYLHTLLIALVVGLFVLVWTAEASALTISGTVKDTRGRVVTGLPVVLFAGQVTTPAATTQTDLNGAFSFLTVVAGTYFLHAEGAARGYVDVWYKDSLLPASATPIRTSLVSGFTQADFVLRGSRTISGTVTRAGDPSKLDSVVEVISNDGFDVVAKRVTTDAQGNYSAPGLLPGPERYYLKASYPGFITHITHSGGYGVTTGDLGAASITLRKGEIAGRLVDANNQIVQPLPPGSPDILAAYPFQTTPVFQLLPAQGRFQHFPRQPGVPQQPVDYVIWGVPPGRYYIATTPSINTLGFLEQWYNQARSLAGATVVEVPAVFNEGQGGAAGLVRGIDFVLSRTATPTTTTTTTPTTPSTTTTTLPPTATTTTTSPPTTTTTTQPGAPGFVDVSSSNPYAAAIGELARRGVISGYDRSDGLKEFRPGNAVLRAQFAKMIDGALGLVVSEDLVSPFSDMGPDALSDLYPHEYVAAAFANAITEGITPTTFGPYVAIPRAQVVTMVVRAMQRLRPGVLLLPPAGYVNSWGTGFSSTHGENARIAEFNGLLAGLPLSGGASDPWAAMPRGEVAQVLWNLMGR